MSKCPEHQIVQRNHDQGSAQGAVEIALQASGLQAAHALAQDDEHRGQQIDQSVHQVLVDGAADIAGDAAQEC